MKAALISDIHGNIPALEAVYQSIKEKGISEVFNLGDSLYGPLWPEETACFIKNNNFISIIGNEDEDLIKYPQKNDTVKYTLSQLSESTISWLKKLPYFYINNYLTLFHGSPNNIREYFLEKIYNGKIEIKTNEEISKNLGNIKTKYVGFGHSHLERILLIKDQILINAGSVGLPAFLDDTPKHKVETYNNYAKYIVLDNKNVEICYVEYNYKDACKKAIENNRIDWSRYIEYGRVI